MRALSSFMERYASYRTVCVFRMILIVDATLINSVFESSLSHLRSFSIFLLSDCSFIVFLSVGFLFGVFMCSFSSAESRSTGFCRSFSCSRQSGTRKANAKNSSPLDLRRFSPESNPRTRRCLCKRPVMHQCNLPTPRMLRRQPGRILDSQLPCCLQIC